MTLRSELEKAVAEAANVTEHPSWDADRRFANAMAAGFIRDHGPALLEALADAERYRWLRDINNPVEAAVLDRVWEDVYVKNGEKLDTAIDAGRGDA